MRRLAVALAMALAWSPTLANEPPKDAVENIVAVSINGRAVAQSTVLLQTPDGDVWLERKDWEDLGLALPADKTGLISAKSLGIEPKHDTLAQSMALVVPGRLLPMQNLTPGGKLPEKVDAQPKGAFINYDVAGYVRDDRSYGVSVGHEVSAGIGNGTLVSTGQLNFQEGEVEYVRGVSTWNHDFLKKGVAMQLGDVFTPRSQLSGPVNLAGVRLASDRALRNGREFHPVPMLGGIADTRSSAQLIVNDATVGQYKVKPGPYQLDRYPALRGFNEAQLVVRDEFGREQVINERFYNANGNLRKGQTEFDVSAGLIRQDPSSNTYGAPAVAGQIVHGVSDNWTIGGSVQATQDSRNVGVQSNLTLGAAGALTVDVAQSTSPAGKGSASAIAYDYIGHNWSVRAAHSQYSENYWTLNDEQNTGGLAGGTVKSISSLGGSLNPRGSRWSVSASAVDIKYHDGRNPTQRIDVSGRYRMPSNQFGVGLSYDAQTGDKQVMATWRKTFGPDLSLSTSINAAPEITATAQLDGRSKWGEREVKWNAGALYNAETRATNAFGSASTQFDNGHLNVYGRYSQESSEIGAQWNGSVWVGEGGIATQAKSSGGFVVVEVPGQVGLPVFSGGGFQNKTNKHGYAVVPNIQPLATQSIQINSKDLPLDVGIENTTKTVVAGRGAGAKVVFEVTTETMREAVITYQGKPVDPPARLISSQEDLPVGRGGVVVMEKPIAGEVVKVQLTDTEQCSATMPEKIGAFETIIELECK